jgi:hypothetical protein
MRWAGHVAHMGEKRHSYNILARNLEGRDHSEDLSVDGKISKCILEKQGGKLWTRFI